jgi:hypothetical protein
MQQRHEVQGQPNFRRALTSKLRRLVDTKKIEKVNFIVLQIYCSLFF